MDKASFDMESCKAQCAMDASSCVQTGSRAMSCEHDRQFCKRMCQQQRGLTTNGHFAPYTQRTSKGAGPADLPAYYSFLKQ